MGIGQGRERTILLAAALLVGMAAGCGGDREERVGTPAVPPSTNLASPSASPPAFEIRVAAAADLRRAFTETGARFEKETGAKVTLLFGSTGLLARQIEEGAPFDVFAAADERFVQELEKQGRIAPGTRRLYATGRLVVWTRRGAPRARSLADLAGPGFRRVAIANPLHAPYGMAAREALQKAGLWDKVRPKLVYGENVQQAFQYAETGNADAGIVALSLAVGSGGQHIPVPERLHAPIRQALGVVAGSRQPALARRFKDYVCGPIGRAILRRYGFEVRKQ